MSADNFISQHLNHLNANNLGYLAFHIHNTMSQVAFERSCHSRRAEETHGQDALGLGLFKYSYKLNLSLQNMRACMF